MRSRYSTGSGNVFNDIGPKVLLKWHSKDKEEKCKVYQKYICHEFNFFIKQKDNGFF